MNREFVLLMEFSQCKEEWNTVPMENGTQSVMMSGRTMTPKLSVVNWDMKVKVMKFLCEYMMRITSLYTELCILDSKT